MAKVKKFLLILFSCLFILGFVFYTYQHLDEFIFIKTLSYSYLALLLFLSFIYLYLQGVIYNQALKWFDFQLQPMESFGLLLLTIFGNYLFPFSGLGLRAKYLQKKYQFDYRSFSSSLLLIVAIETLVFLFGAVIACIANDMQATPIPSYLIQMIYFLFFAGFFGLILRAHQIFLKFKIFAILRLFFDQWDRLWLRHEIVLQIMFWNIFLYLTSVMMFKISLAMFDLTISWQGLLLVASLTNLSILFRITPAAIGTFDGAVIFCLKLFGITIPQGMMIATLIRFSTIFWVVFATPFITYMSLGGKNYIKKLNLE